MPPVKPYDFGGWATKNNLKCSDGRTILQDAFKDNDGVTVPLVWAHLHNSPDNVLGHALLENRKEGTYAYGNFNTTPKGKVAKQLVESGDITFLSIFANDLVQDGGNVKHGVIREVSLVLSGANKGAKIENISIAHSDGSVDEVDDEVIIHTGENIILPEIEEPVMAPDTKKVIEHAAAAAPASSPNETVADIFDTLTDKQKEVVYAIIAEVVDSAGSTDTAAQSALQNNNDGGDVMKNNVFDKATQVEEPEETLTHDQLKTIFDDTTKYSGSLKASFLAHADEYGITDINLLFPDATAISNSPAMISRRMEWVSAVLAATNHSPFSRIKSFAADITADAARAKGYVKGAKKIDEVIKMLRRITTPKTIYKKQKLDRDDIIDIVDLDIVAWMKAEMRVMLDEELARAVIIGDGRESTDPDKIDETNVRPIWTDDDIYAYHVRVTSSGTTDDIIDAIVRARENYFGSGSPTLYTSSGFVSDMLLLKDEMGRRMYMTLADLQAVLRVSNIVEIPAISSLTRESDDDTPVTLNLIGIVVNLKDYTIGADKGGSVNMFDDFDIDYNQFKYLLETRVSGALTLPKSALVIEQVATVG